MNLQLKAIILKEVAEVLGRNYWGALVLYSILFSGIGFYLFNSIVNQPQLQDLNIINFAIELYLVIIPPFAMWLFNEQFIREKFGDEKLLRKFETILTTPVSLTTVWAGKIAAIFLLSYPLAILTIITFYLIWMILGESSSVIIPSAASGVMILVVGPITPVVYASFAGWAILRFANWQRIMELLFLLAIAAFIGIFFVSNIFLTDGTTELITNWWTIITSITGVIAFFVLAFYLVSHLDKERVISN
jgi:ABC-type Na+ efflux pump permease subunit